MVHPLLLTVSVWWGPSRAAGPNDKVSSTITTEAFYTELPLPEALAAIRDYEHKYENVYGRLTAVNITTLGVSILPCQLDEDDRENGRMRMIETMSAHLDEELAEQGSWRDQESCA